MSNQIAEKIYCIKCSNSMGRKRFNKVTDNSALDLVCEKCGLEFTVQIFDEQSAFKKISLSLNSEIEIKSYHCPFHENGLLKSGMRLVSKNFEQVYTCSNLKCKRNFEII